MWILLNVCHWPLSHVILFLILPFVISVYVTSYWTKGAYSLCLEMFTLTSKIFFFFPGILARSVCLHVVSFTCDCFYLCGITAISSSNISGNWGLQDDFCSVYHLSPLDFVKTKACLPGKQWHPLTVNYKSFTKIRSYILVQLYLWCALCSIQSYLMLRLPSFFFELLDGLHK